MISEALGVGSLETMMGGGGGGWQNSKKQIFPRKLLIKKYIFPRVSDQGVK